MKDDLIRRSDAIEWLKEAHEAGDIDPYTSIQRKCCFEEAINCIEEIPTAEPKRGKWVRVGNVAHTEHKCSMCGKNPTRIVVDTKLVDNYFCSMAEPITEYIFGELLSDFCPNCGAYMRKGADDE